MVSVIGGTAADTIDGIRAEYGQRIEDAQARVTEAKAAHAFWSGLTGNRFFERYTGGKRDRMVSIHSEMESCKPAELPRLQGELAALKSDLERLKILAEPNEVTQRESALADLKARQEKEIRDLQESYPLLVDSGDSDSDEQESDLESDGSND